MAERTRIFQRAVGVASAAGGDKLQFFGTVGFVRQGNVTVIGVAPSASHVGGVACAYESLPLCIGRNDESARARVVRIRPIAIWRGGGVPFCNRTGRRPCDLTVPLIEL